MGPSRDRRGSGANRLRDRRAHPISWRSPRPKISEVTDEPTITCFYCGLDKPKAEFSDEHIWPGALGGDHLPRFWRTDQVCAKCNSMSGVFVDGAFIRGWAGSAERGHGAQEYLSLTEPLKTALSLDYLGRLTDPNIDPREVAEWWAGPCGATIVHFRPKESEDLWSSYQGGDPRAKKGRAGRAYIALASDQEYWILAALGSFKQHFKRAQRYVVNAALPPSWTGFGPVDRTNPAQAADLKIFDAITAAAKAGKSVHAQQQLQLDAGHRFLCKLGLALGCQLFGAGFGTHEHGEQLRRAFRDPNVERRRQIPIRGSGYFSGPQQSALQFFGWPGGWALMLQVASTALSLAVITPSRRPMAIQITDDPALLAALPDGYAAGQVWVTVPTISQAVGPITTPNYIAHLVGGIPNPELIALAAARIDPALLPSC